MKARSVAVACLLAVVAGAALGIVGYRVLPMLSGGAGATAAVATPSAKLARPRAAPLPAEVNGPVDKVPNAATLVVGDRRVRLAGIDPGPAAGVASFETWLHGQSALHCERQGQTTRYRCLTADNRDVAVAALLNGIARVGEGAPADYRKYEEEAREACRGLWKCGDNGPTPPPTSQIGATSSATPKPQQR